MTDIEKGKSEKNDAESGPNDQQETRTGPTPAVNAKQERSLADATSRPEISVSDWNGPDDPDNPHYWSAWKRFHHTLSPALLGFAV